MSNTYKICKKTIQRNLEIHMQNKNGTQNELIYRIMYYIILNYQIRLTEKETIKLIEKMLIEKEEYFKDFKWNYVKKIR